MPPQSQKSSLKRARGSNGEVADPKKARRSSRLSGLAPPETPDTELLSSPAKEKVKRKTHLPSPVTRRSTTTTAEPSRGTVSPESAGARQVVGRDTPASSPPPDALVGGLSSPPSDTQPYSQFLPPAPIVYEVDNEEEEGVWGYLIPVKGRADSLVLKRRAACPVPGNKTGNPNGHERVRKKHWEKKEEEYEKEKATRGVPAGGYLIGRHPECDCVVNVPTVSNRHCLFFPENKEGDSIAVLEDLSGNGTYVNDGIVGRNKHRQLSDGDEVSILDEARFIFRYPRRRDANGFKQQYTIQGQLGKGHFATVYLCTEKSTGVNYAVKKFEKRRGPSERHKVEGLQQEIAVLMGVGHPNMLCLKDTFDESDGVYLVLELAAEGELFNYIVEHQKLTEVQARKVFIQLFQGVKYLHERNIVHRDIKPENILLSDRDLHIKLADFGLAKIIGEESFTSTLCGTPSYVAPEILEQSNRRRYTRAVDVWSLGVVLYICLCGFPPFSDELCTRANPYTLSQQIKLGRFDYPSPYWDSVGDPALDLIDKMLTVDVEKRITIDECLEHPWTTNRGISLTDSTDGLTGALAGLDFSRRKPVRERTLLASINDVKVERVIQTQPDEPPVKVFDKKGKKNPTTKVRIEATVEPSPDAARNPEEFLEMGGRGDQTLYSDSGSRYPAGAMD